MGIIGGTIGYRLLKRLSTDGGVAHQDGSAYAGKSKLEILLGADVWRLTRGRDVIDYGAGEGSEAIEMAVRGARMVVGVEIQAQLRVQAAAAAERAGVGNRVHFVESTAEATDVVVCLDSFEHFLDPEQELRRMYELLRPGGVLLASFGPTWYHPYGGHLFSVFPWAHLLFTESALIRWRSDFKTDGATRFSEVAGGLNQMTIGRFERLIRASPFADVTIELVPIRAARRFATYMTREFTTSIVRAVLRKA